MPKLRSGEDEFSRLTAMLSYLEAQMEESELLLQYLNRLTPVASLMTLHRWKEGKNFPQPKKRPMLARAIGCTKQALDSFLFNGIPSPQEFFSSLPPVPDEYRRRSSRVLIDISLEEEVFKGMVSLAPYLSKARTHQFLAWLQQQVSTEDDGDSLDWAEAGAEDGSMSPMQPSEPAASSAMLPAKWNGSTQKLALFLEILDMPVEQLAAIARFKKK